MIATNHWLVFLAWFLGGFVNGISGMGAAMVSLPILVLRLPLLDAVVISGVSASALSLAQGWVYRKGARLSALPPLLWGSLPGGIAGIFILKTVPETALQLIMGLGLVGYSLWLVRHQASSGHGDNAVLGVVAGFFSGAAGASIGFCGPPAGLYAVYAGWDKKAVLGSLCIYSIGICLLTNILHGLAGFYTSERLIAALYAVAGALVGLLFSIPVSRTISARFFRTLLLVTIGLAGTVCMLKSFL